MGISSFRDLRVWQVGMDLVDKVYRVTQEFPKHESFGLTGQMRRAAISIPSNIAEGHTRQHSKEYLQHLSMAQGSLAEMATQLEIAARLGYVTREQAGPVVEQVASLGKQLHALRSALAGKGTGEGARS